MSYLMLFDDYEEEYEEIEEPEAILDEPQKLQIKRNGKWEDVTK